VEDGYVRRVRCSFETQENLIFTIVALADHRIT